MSCVEIVFLLDLNWKIISYIHTHTIVYLLCASTFAKKTHMAITDTNKSRPSCIVVMSTTLGGLLVLQRYSTSRVKMFEQEEEEEETLLLCLFVCHKTHYLSMVALANSVETYSDILLHIFNTNGKIFTKKII